MQYDMLIAIRCHDYPALTLDTYDSIMWSVDPERTKVIFAVDGRKDYAKRLKSQLKDPDIVYCSNRMWGWGAPLWGLMVETIKWARERWDFSHFTSLDYDSYAINKDADAAILDHITDYKIGLMGQYIPNNPHWSGVFASEYRPRNSEIEELRPPPGKTGKTRPTFKAVFGKVPIPPYIPGEGVQGGCMTLTSSLLTAMEERGMFEGKFAEASKYTKIADDHLVSIFTRICGLEIKDLYNPGVTFCYWNMPITPKGLEKRGYKIIHPIKLRPRPKDTERGPEIEIRNYFRKQRGRKPMKKGIL